MTADVFAIPNTPRWADRVHELTPVQDRAGRWYKRDDLFAPAGPGDVNGGKLRQLLYLAEHALPASAIVTGCSVLSPQAPMAAAVAAQYGVPCHVVYGGTSPETAGRHAPVRLALRWGAQLHYVPVGYNPTLQAAVRDLHARHPGSWMLRYGITTPPEASAGAITEFHLLGARQVSNLPAEVTTLIVPLGSANSATSILTGLALRPPARLRRVILVQIGPPRFNWMRLRLDAISAELGRPIPHPRHSLELIDLYGAGVRYGVRRPWSADGITFHPTYEGKVMQWAETGVPGWAARDGSTCCWIVGSEPGCAAC